MKYREYREVKLHGSSEFPFEYYLVDKNHPHYVMPLHWHTNFEVIHVISGKLSLHLDNVEYILSADDVAFVGCGVMHRAEPCDCLYECAVFDLSIISGYNTTKVFEYIGPIISQNAEVDAICASASPYVIRLFEIAAGEEEYYELEIASALSRLLCELYRAEAIRNITPDSKKISHRRSVMAQLIDEIEKNYAQKITLSDLAESAQINEKYLCRFFKEFTGFTPIDYINRLRIDKACYQLAVNKMNVTEAAYECGFNELSYFSKCFRKYKGISPGAYRSKYLKINTKEV
ncbi:MAG: helix-turn-helix domain-containing protein [Ruminococcaceae bacterium]|nr:helix-turn-helix domain-containing protein [Oscillospiraceae bacterium]